VRSSSQNSDEVGPIFHRPLKVSVGINNDNNFMPYG